MAGHPWSAQALALLLTMTLQPLLSLLLLFLFPLLSLLNLFLFPLLPPPVLLQLLHFLVHLLLLPVQLALAGRLHTRTALPQMAALRCAA